MNRREVLKGLASLALPLPALAGAEADPLMARMTQWPCYSTYEEFGTNLYLTAPNQAAIDAAGFALDALLGGSLIAIDHADLAEMCRPGPWALAETTLIRPNRPVLLPEAIPVKAFYACRLTRPGVELTLGQFEREIEALIPIVGDRPLKYSTFEAPNEIGKRTEGLSVLRIFKTDALAPPRAHRRELPDFHFGFSGLVKPQGSSVSACTSSGRIVQT